MCSLTFPGQSHRRARLGRLSSHSNIIRLKWSQQLQSIWKKKPFWGYLKRFKGFFSFFTRNNHLFHSKFFILQLTKLYPKEHIHNIISPNSLFHLLGQLKKKSAQKLMNSISEQVLLYQILRLSHALYAPYCFIRPMQTLKKCRCLMRIRDKTNGLSKT